MLEQQITKLTERVLAVEKRLEVANELLAAILSAIREGGLSPAQADAVSDTPDEQSDGAQAGQVGDAPEDVAPATIDDVRDALMTYRDAHGRDATIELMSRFLPQGVKPIVGEIPEAKFGDLIAACLVAEKAAA